MFSKPSYLFFNGKMHNLKHIHTHIHWKRVVYVFITPHSIDEFFCFALLIILVKISHFHCVFFSIFSRSFSIREREEKKIMPRSKVFRFLLSYGNGTIIISINDRAIFLFFFFFLVFIMFSNAFRSIIQSQVRIIMKECISKQTIEKKKL